MEDLSMSGKRPFMSGKRPFKSRKTSTYCQENVHLNPLKAIHYKGYKRPIKYKFKNIYKIKKGALFVDNFIFNFIFHNS